MLWPRPLVSYLFSQYGSRRHLFEFVLSILTGKLSSDLARHISLYRCPVLFARLITPSNTAVSDFEPFSSGGILHHGFARLWRAPGLALGLALWTCQASFL